MTPLGQLILFIAQVVNLFYIVLIIRIIMSWINPQAMYRQSSPPMRMLMAITEPVMAPFRAFIPPIGGIDFSPIFLFILLGLLQRTLASLAYQV
jgi:YggT family protein